mmetsp:Transcript_37655/g.81952  ORF Transcript_37655/g.81952 Transcript_37655/m.81952 type:complete len:222 (+) Transcript_37655:281-946(+)
MATAATTLSPPGASSVPPSPPAHPAEPALLAPALAPPAALAQSVGSLVLTTVPPCPCLSAGVGSLVLTTVDSEVRGALGSIASEVRAAALPACCSPWGGPVRKWIALRQAERWLRDALHSLLPCAVDSLLLAGRSADAFPVSIGLAVLFPFGLASDSVLFVSGRPVVPLAWASPEPLTPCPRSTWSARCDPCRSCTHSLSETSPMFSGCFRFFVVLSADGG